MSRPVRHSFRTRLSAAFLLVSLVPLLICSTMLLQIFRLRLNSAAREEAQEYLDIAAQALDGAYEGFVQAAAQLQADPLVAGALSGQGGEATQVYSRLFSATQPVRAYACFDLYDSGGTLRYSTRSGSPASPRLSTSWGVLHAAAQADGLVFSACEDVTDTGAPLLQGAVPLTGPEGERAGYLVISLYESHLRALLDGKYGAQNELILLSRYWRPVYCAQPSLAASLAPVLRQQLLAGEELTGGTEEFLYRVEYHSSTGLYLVLQRPQVFTRDTMRLLYTVSLSCALAGVVVSVLISLNVSRKMFRPIQRLHEGIGEVGQNNLDVYVPPMGDDELGELAQSFNGMVAALKRNQEELVENQRELNEAQIRMLQAQLNPHFLCNTLDTMKWISKINQVPQVAVMATDLADILRFCVSPEEFVPLHREVEILQRYIEIQKIRLSSSLTFRVDVPPELEDCLVPKMILQPLVENAILHGLDGVEDGQIQVRAQARDGDLLRITVADNGRGLPPEMAGAPFPRGRERPGRQLGLYNVDTILWKHYGEGFGLYLDAGPDGKGAVVSATLPIRRKEETEC
ncbi:MAG: histidine kinase [Candidatus Enterenecus sp.]